MTSSTHWLASQAAMAELEAGGNAFDAAVAGAFVLHVVEPHLNGPGGEVPAVFATADGPTPTVLCGAGPAPGGGARGGHPGPRPPPGAGARPPGGRRPGGPRAPRGVGAPPPTPP